MSACVAGTCAPISSPTSQPEADSPALSPPADVPPPTSSPPPPPPETSTPTASSEPPPAESPPPPESTSTPSAPSTSNASPPPPSSSNSSAEPPPPPLIEWNSPNQSSSSNSTAGSLLSGLPGSTTVSTGIIAGIVIGVAAILVALGILFICCCSKKKRRDQKGGNGYHAPHPPGKDGNNSGHMQYWQQSNPQSAEHYNKSNLPPPPGSSFQPSLSNQSSRNSRSFMNGSGNSGPAHTGSDNSATAHSRGMGFSCSKSSFSYEELAMATNGFSNANFLGQGGFGFVHKGILANGKEVAIKSLKADSGQGEREFQAEIDVISRVHHKHLVTLVGYCITGSQRMLVYEFVQNKTLEYHLYGKGRPPMDWPTRLKIALGSAKGLAYLHEDCHPKIIHRDIKGANILLDFQFEAMVADFGLAKFTEDTDTHVSTRVMGTFGYMAPEYASTGKLTEKSDVFSFGVMLLELITGRRPVDKNKSYADDSLVDWARPLLGKAMEDGNFEPFIDPKLQNNYNHDEMARMVACAAGATSHSAKRRPKMSQIVRALDCDSSLSDPNQGQNRVVITQGSPENPSGQYKEDMKRFKKMVLVDVEIGSSDYTTGTASEYSAYSESSQTTQEMEMAKTKKDGRGFSGSSP